MRKASALVVAGAVLGVLVGCQQLREKLGLAKGEPTARPTPAAGGAVGKPAPPEPALLEEAVLEVEEFKLDEAEVKDLAGAGGGKAVLFAEETAGAETVVPLKKGTYQVTLYAQGSDEDHDAVYLSVAGIENRVYTPEWGKVVACEPVVVVVPKDGPCKVVLLAAETGVYLDKVVLKRVK